MKPEISNRFDVDDIRKIRDYNSQRHAQMTRSEIVEDIRNGAEEIIRKYGLNFYLCKETQLNDFTILHLSALS